MPYYPAMTNREYRRYIDGDGEVMEQRYRDKVVGGADVVRGAIAQELAAYFAEHHLDHDAAELRRIVAGINLDRLFSADLAEVGVALDCWPSFETWVEQQAEADEARALEMRYGL